MKRLSLFFVMLVTAILPSLSQGQSNYAIPLIGSQAPSFTAKSTNGDINFPSDYGNSWKIIFSHPKDFTPVCSSELIELANLQPEFAKLNTKVVVLSTDNLQQHKDWKSSLETVQYEGKATPAIKFPIIDDSDKSISRLYGMLQPASNNERDVRGVFIINPDNVVEAIFFYPTDVGRNMDEIMRTVQALQTTQNNIVTPANWEPGQDVMLSYMTDEQKKELEAKSPNIYQIAWYMTLMKYNSR
jgi:peroxiredoxin 2/4